MNMIDYIHWRGDLSFNASPFNNVDNLIFSYLTYVDLTDVFKNSNKMTLKEASDLFYQNHTIEGVKAVKSLIYLAPIILYEASLTERFKDLVIHDYIKTIDEETDTQFSALTIDINPFISYVSFSGTDDTLIGWKEDFNLSYTITNAQKLAAEYLNKQDHLFKNLYVGGHSKGGNLAIYAASKCNDHVFNKIINVFNNDGPGFNDELFTLQEKEKIADKTIRIIPQFDTFSMIFDTYPYKTIVVKSNEKLVVQHDGVSWQVEGANFVQTETLAKESYMIKEAINNFLNETPLDDRKPFIDAFFKALSDANIHVTADFVKVNFDDLTNIIANISKQDKKFKKIGVNFLEIFKEVASLSIEQAANNVQEFVKDKIEEANNEIKLFASRTTTDIKTSIEEAFNKTKDSINDVFNSTKKKVKEKVDKTSN